MVFDVVLGVALTALVLPVNLSGLEAVPANRPPGPLLVVLTLLAVLPVVVRRRYPMTVLVVTLLAALVMVITRTTVGFATLGPLVASYTAVAHQSQARARQATAVLVAGLAAGALLRPVDLSVEGAVVQVIIFTGGWLLARGTRERRELFAAGLGRAQDEAARERERADTESERARVIATEERLRISRELHDVVGHTLSVIVVQAGVAEQLLTSRPEEARRAVAEIGRTGRQTLDEIRQLLGVLREGDLDRPSATASATQTLADLDALTARVRDAGLAVEVRVDGTRRELPPGIALAGYRVAQEALTNVLKHARASQALVTVRYGSAALDIDVADDGSGASAPSGSSVTGHGLAGMRERVVVYGGSFWAGPAPDGGFAVHASFPLAPVGAAT